MSQNGCARALAVESLLSRTAMPTEGPIYPKNPGRKARREDGVERHQATTTHGKVSVRFERRQFFVWAQPDWGDERKLINWLA